ncbi:GNAT family N-acetyltransferase [Desulfurobacterium atlanticum]|uniref:GNAT family N-acetyltransferase n=1 Tax=Desulfurobacterium atlanticum TaxID=240169 RepID=UPI000B774B84|nr:GNAT family N-acetyltransferase [Desulfurobacterium atlanticum]
MQNLKIRIWNDRDIEVIRNFLKENFPSWEKRVDKDYLNPNIKANLAFIEKTLVGIVIYMVIDSEAEIHLLVVDKNYRRKSVAINLLKETLKMLVNLKVEHVFLEVSNRNSAALNLYEKVGFKQIGIRKNYYGKDNHGIVMMLKIQLREVEDVQRRKFKRACKEKISSLCNP